MSKTLIFLFLTFFSLTAKSQILYADDKNLKNSSTLWFFIEQYKGSYIFMFQFLNSDDCQKKSELLIKTKNGKVKKLKHNKPIGCEKEWVGFSIDTSKIKLTEIDKVRYFNMDNLENYDFKINLK